VSAKRLSAKRLSAERLSTNHCVGQILRRQSICRPNTFRPKDMNWLSIIKFLFGTNKLKLENVHFHQKGHFE
jgi:hypothetical protein